MKYILSRMKEYSTWTMLALAALVSGFVPDQSMKWVVFGFLFCGAWVADADAKAFWAKVKDRVWGNIANKGGN